MSRIKILLLILIIAVLSIIFVQNQQPITLKLLCADSSQACLYQTPSLPLAVWIALATLTGAIALLLIQTLDRFGYGNSSRKSPILDDDLYSNGTGSKNKTERDSRYSKTTDFNDTVRDDVKSYETKQEPKSVEQSGSIYSYKYREAGEKSDRDNNRNSVDPEIKRDPNSEPDGEDWI